jgi:hypothetical protein
VGHSAALHQLLQSTLGMLHAFPEAPRPGLRPPGLRHSVPAIADGYLQINELAIFGGCIGVVAWIPTILALLLPLLRYGLRPTWNRRGIWLRDFAAEEPGEADGISTDLIPIKKRTWSAPAIVLILSSTVGLAISILAALDPGAGPLFSTPVIPHVSIP